jgi:tetratricopeptide (TPR) repeat protein
MVSPRWWFSLRLWLLLIAWSILPLACAGPSQPPQHQGQPVAKSHSPPPRPPDPCEVAAGLRGKVAGFLDEGRLDRTVRLIQKANRLCQKSAPATWTAEVSTLAALGRYAEARALAATIDADASTGDDAKKAAAEARARCDQLDKVFPETDEAKKEMRRLFGEAAALEVEGRQDEASQRAIKEKFLAAWEAWRPNGQSLVGAGFAAKRLGEKAEAQRLFDRALVELEKAQGKPVALEVPNWFSEDLRGVLAIAWSRDGRRIAVGHGQEISIFDLTWRENFRSEGTSTM